MKPTKEDLRQLYKEASKARERLHKLAEKVSASLHAMDELGSAYQRDIKISTDLARATYAIDDALRNLDHGVDKLFSASNR